METTNKNVENKQNLILDPHKKGEPLESTIASLGNKKEVIWLDSFLQEMTSSKYCKEFGVNLRKEYVLIDFWRYAGKNQIRELVEICDKMDVLFVLESNCFRLWKQ